MKCFWKLDSLIRKWVILHNLSRRKPWVGHQLWHQLCDCVLWLIGDHLGRIIYVVKLFLLFPLMFISFPSLYDVLRSWNFFNLWRVILFITNFWFIHFQGIIGLKTDYGTLHLKVSAHASRPLKSKWEECA